ncbi:ankyrin repeat-containing domain protein [Paraphoma chrysanthemicola]|uniref:Ankyrin repeat-containing domain protein n=1 Tax=Paraphoma chrysanthemicola TaxID=798071 RepID=A0A8K0R510_9PLEO|nr:ankyrin repeat-containing domain protein [Paraphoma chrysanthemicola]
MPDSENSKLGKHTPNLWKEAYNALSEDDKGKERLQKLNTILKEQLGKPKLKVRSEDGYKQLQNLINRRSQALVAKLVSAGANVAGPYVAIPAAALFLAFSVHQLYKSEKESMFELARKVAHYTVLHATSPDRIKKAPGDDPHMRDLKRNLHMLYIGMYKTLLLASAQLTISLYGDWQFIKNLMKHYDWVGQIKELDEHHQLCKDYRDEMIARQNDPHYTQPTNDRPMGPGPRNPLHWAVAFGVPEQVMHLVQKNEYQINALTPRKWTAAHLAAQHGSTKIMKTLLTAGGIDLRIKNKEGHTPLHIAALYNKVGALKLLLQRDRELLGLRDDRGRTAFLLAAQGGHTKVLGALKENGQDFNETTLKNGWTALHLAAENGKVDAVKFLINNGTKKWTKVKAGNREGCTAKQVAEFKKRLNVVAIL